MLILTLGPTKQQLRNMFHLKWDARNKIASNAAIGRWWWYSYNWNFNSGGHCDWSKKSTINKALQAIRVVHNFYEATSQDV